MRTKFDDELRDARLRPGPPPAGPTFSERDLDALPSAVQRYLRFMRVPGEIRDWSFQARFTGRFRMGPDAAWKSVEVNQYNTRLDVARIFHLRLRLFGLIPILGRDTYRDGAGRMLIRPFDLFTVEDAHGPELDLGELVTYLNDAILFAPSMILGPETTWTEVDDLSFDVSLADRGHVVTARVSLDEAGAPHDFSTTDRYLRDPDAPGHPLVRARWTTPVMGWKLIDGRMRPVAGKAIWHLPRGEFCYVELGLEDGSMAFNVPPGATPIRSAA